MKAVAISEKMAEIPASAIGPPDSNVACIDEAGANVYCRHMAVSLESLWAALGQEQDDGAFSWPSEGMGHPEPPVAIQLPAEDTALLARLRAGDPAALGALYDAHAQAMWRLAARFVQTGTDAEDLAHDVFVSLWERRTLLTLRAPWRVYLLGAVRRRALDRARHRRVTEQASQIADSESPPGMGAASLSPDAAIDAAALRSAVLAALSRFSPTQRTMLALRWRDQLSYQEIAAVMDISVAAAKQQVSRMQRALRPMLEPFFGP